MAAHDRIKAAYLNGSDRTLEQSLAHAEKLRGEIPHLIQPEASAYDIVILADELLRLNDKMGNYLRLATEKKE